MRQGQDRSRFDLRAILVEADPTLWLEPPPAYHDLGARADLLRARLDRVALTLDGLVPRPTVEATLATGERVARHALDGPTMRPRHQGSS